MPEGEKEQQEREQEVHGGKRGDEAGPEAAGCGCDGAAEGEEGAKDQGEGDPTRSDLEKVLTDLNQRVMNVVGDVFRGVQSRMGKAEGGAQAASPGKYAPKADFVETGESFILSLELPGMSKEAIDVSFDGEKLVITGDKRPDYDLAVGERHYAERPYGVFNRVFRLPGEVAEDGVDAEYKAGVLTVTLTKAAAPKGPGTKIKVGGE